MIIEKQAADGPEGVAPVTPPKTKERRIAGLDSLRAVLATWVVLGHIPIAGYMHLSKKSTGLLGTTFVGVVAVMAFFIISGFCIHLPYSRGRNLSLRSYFVRREVRMLIPIAVAVILGYAIHSFEYVSVLWSLVCEEIYYAIYPFILPLRRKYGWRPIFAFSIVGSILVIIFGSHKGGNFHEVGYAWTWLLAFPVWLMGAVLAEKADGDTLKAPSSLVIWGVRGSIWLASFLVAQIRFHSKLDYQTLLVPFSVILYYWMTLEVAYFRENEPKKWLETAGKASYTLYLTHTFAPPIVALLALPIVGLPKWIFTMLVVGILCYALYKLVEAPSHKLARMLGEKIDGRAKAKATAS